MKPLTSRDLGVQAFIMMAVAAGISILVIAPLRQELGDARAHLAASRAILADASHLGTVSRPGEVDALVVDATRRITAAGRTAADPAALHEFLMDLARRSGVTIDSISPEPLSPNSFARDSRHLTRVLTCTTLLAGDYPNLIEFLRTLEAEGGLMAVQSCELRPTLSAEGAVTSMALVTEHFAFHVPTLDEMQELASADDEDEEE
ncbi:MAG: hypothetical protein KDA21_01925 [Phycisphaerales bacterium]|nr:hypothetical protein [Phycisphaerales bacterium]